MSKKFRLKLKKVDGQYKIVIESTSEVIKHEDGRQDVIIHAPSLGLLNKYVNSNEFQEALKKLKDQEE